MVGGAKACGVGWGEGGRGREGDTRTMPSRCEGVKGSVQRCKGLGARRRAGPDLGHEVPRRRALHNHAPPASPPASPVTRLVTSTSHITRLITSPIRGCQRRPGTSGRGMAAGWGGRRGAGTRHPRYASSLPPFFSPRKAGRSPDRRDGSGDTRPLPPLGPTSQGRKEPGPGHRNRPARNQPIRKR